MLVEVETHDPTVGRDLLLGLLVVLERVDLDMSDVLGLLLLTAHAHCEHVFLQGVPHDAGDHL